MNCRNQYPSNSQNINLHRWWTSNSTIELSEKLSSLSPACDDVMPVPLPQEVSKLIEAGTAVSTHEQRVARNSQVWSNSVATSGSGSDVRIPLQNNVPVENEWKVVERKRLKYRFAGCKGRAIIEPNFCVLVELKKT